MTDWFTTDTCGRVQIEITNYCNARCPQCSREDFILAGRSDRLNSRHITMEQIDNWFTPFNWDNLSKIHFCGDIDEPTLNPELIQMIEYFKGDRFPKLNDIAIATNGGTRNIKFWQDLGTQPVKVVFGIDGLEDTNHLYRRNVRWDKLYQNFTAFIAAGGRAIWQFIVFEHNEHQIDAAHQLSKELGFESFQLIGSNRIQNEVKPIQTINHKLLENDIESNNVVCKANLNSGVDTFHDVYGNIFIDFNGQLLPCCWLGNQDKIEALKTQYDLNNGELSLHNHNFNEILSGEFWRKIHSDITVHPTCIKKCKLNNRDTRYTIE